MVKSFITGTAQGVTDSVKRVTNIMKGRPHAEKQAAAMERKELGKRASPKSPPGKTG